MTIVVLEDETSRVEIARRGAELRAWRVEGSDLIWTPDADIWPDTAPILFPVVGWTKGGAVAVDGLRYPLGLHGFARHHEFDVVEQWPRHVRLELRSSVETLELYPFRFGFAVEHALDDGALTTTLTIRNDDERPLPYACGLHPGFRWPFAGGAVDEYRIVFGERERSAVPVISPDGFFTRQSRHVPLDGRRLDLSEALLAREALCFLDARSRSLRFAHRSGAAIDIELQDFPHIALWSRPPGRFLSIEAWTGYGDPVDHDGELARKPSMRWLEPGASASHAAKFSFAPPHLLFR